MLKKKTLTHWIYFVETSIFESFCYSICTIRLNAAFDQEAMRLIWKSSTLLVTQRPSRWWQISTEQVYNLKFLIWWMFKLRLGNPWSMEFRILSLWALRFVRGAAICCRSSGSTCSCAAQCQCLVSTLTRWSTFPPDRQCRLHYNLVERFTERRFRCVCRLRGRGDDKQYSC
jgi:hypothetical protein